MKLSSSQEVFNSNPMTCSTTAEVFFSRKKSSKTSLSFEMPSLKKKDSVSKKKTTANSSQGSHDAPAPATVDLRADEGLFGASASG